MSYRFVLRTVLLLLLILPASAQAAEIGTWEPLGPEGGSITALVPGAGDTVWARSAEGALFRSPDRGETWAASGALPAVEPHRPHFVKLAADPLRPSVVYALGSHHDVWRSEDGGATWTALTSGGPAVASQFFAAVESGSTVLWRLLPGSNLQRSADGGVTWNRVGGSGSVTGFDRDLAVASDGSVYLAANTGLFRPGAGFEWVRIAGVPAVPVHGVAVAPSDPRRVYAVLDDGRVFSSGDSGDTWGPTGADLVPQGLFRILGTVVAPDDPDRVHVLFGKRSVSVSSDGGRTWRRSGPGLDQKLESILPLSMGRLLGGLAQGRGEGVALAPGGVLVSQGGLGWREPRVAVRGLAVERVAVRPGEPPEVYAGIEAGGFGNLLVNRGGGVEWSLIDTPDALAPITFLEVAPRDRSRIYAAVYDGLYERGGDGEEWQRSRADCLDVTAFAVAPSAPRVVYYAGVSLIGRCDVCHLLRRGADGEVTCIAGFEEGPRSASSLAVDGTEPDRVYAAVGSLWTSGDGGDGWSELPLPLDDGAASAVAAAPLMEGSLYVGTVRGAVWGSSDGGASWIRLREADGRLSEEIVIDPVEPRRLYLRAGGALFGSDDGGGTWSRLGDGLPQHARVLDLALDPADPAVLHAAVAGAGVWRLNRRLPTGTCAEDGTTLCLGTGDRFRVRVAWQDFEHAAGRGRAVPRTATPGDAETGAFWFFDQDNLELLVKVIDGADVNRRHWVFYGALTNVPFTLVVTDTATGESVGYDNPPRRFASRGDTIAFPETGLGGPAPPPGDAAPPLRDTVEPAPCAPSATTLCLGADGRFRVKVAWEDFQGGSGTGTAVPETDDTGFFWFFKESNLELAVKVLDGRPVNGNFWVFYGALTNVPFRLTVTDTLTGEVRTYVNPSRNFASRGDVDAFDG